MEVFHREQRVAWGKLVVVHLPGRSFSAERAFESAELRNTRHVVLVARTAQPSGLKESLRHPARYPESSE